MVNDVTFSILDTERKGNYYKYVFRRDGLPFIAIRTKKEFRKFLQDNELKVISKHDKLFNHYKLSKKIEDTYIWSLDQIKDKEKAIPFYGLSNGSMTTCYRVIEDDKVIWYRPNSNSKLYNPMPTKTHLQYINEVGS